MSRRRARICEAKVLYTDQAEAEAEAARWVARGEAIETYECGHEPGGIGHHWHVGHVLADDAVDAITARWQALKTKAPTSGWERHYLHDVRILLDRLRGLPHLEEARLLLRKAGNP